MNGRALVFTAGLKVTGILWRRLGLYSSNKGVKSTGNRMIDPHDAAALQRSAVSFLLL